MHFVLTILTPWRIFASYGFFYSGVFSTYLSISVDDFYPFGDENGDSKLPRRDDAVSQSIEFPTSFAFFNVDRHNCYVSIFYLNLCGCIIKKYLDVKSMSIAD